MLLRRLLHLLLLLLLVAADVPIFCHAAPPDAASMASIAQSLTGIPANWIPGNDPCNPKWDYVSCTAGRVVSLHLGNRSLSGDLSESINDLSALTVLHLQNNNISGPLPSLSSLSNLQELLLDFNSFSSLPDDFFSGFTAIQTVNLDYNPLAAWSMSNAANVCVNLQRLSAMRANLSGSIPAFFGSFSSLEYLRLPHNNLTGDIPIGLTGLKNLSYVNLISNNLTGKVPNFSPNVTLMMSGNPLLQIDRGEGGGSPSPSPSVVVSPPSPPPPSVVVSPSPPPAPSVASPPPPSLVVSSPSSVVSPPPPFNPIIYKPPAPRKVLHRLHSLSAGDIALVFLALFGLLGIVLYCWMKGKKKFERINPDGQNDEKGIRILGKKLSIGLVTGMNVEKECEGAALMKGQGQPMSFKTLWKATDNFCHTNLLGRGGFGMVYRGELNGTVVAVKRSSCNSGEVNKKSFDAEIGALKNVRHRNLVALLGYCMENGERLLVYEFMSNGTLADHLFAPYKSTSYPLNWKQRLIIALDVARGVDYLHSLAQESFIHRDLKPSNILLNDDLRAKVSDFGLVKLVDKMHPMTTKIAGTFGYLAPEYAFNGKVTKKVDVYAFGVVLMEIITSKKALDPSFPEDEQHIVTLFNKNFATENRFKEFMDSTFLDGNEAYACACKVAELAIYCTDQDPQQRPEMSHAVNALGPMVEEQWRPSSGYLQSGSDHNYAQFQFNTLLSIAEYNEQSTFIGSNNHTV